MAEAPVEVRRELVAELAERAGRRSRRTAGALLGLALVQAVYGTMTLLQVDMFASTDDVPMIVGSLIWTVGLVALALPMFRRARRAEQARELAALDAARFYVSEKLVSATRDGVPWPDASFAIDRAARRRLLAIPRAIVVK